MGFGKSPVYYLLISLLILSATVFAQSSGTAADRFEVQPGIAAPGQFVQFSWQINHASAFSVSPSLLAEQEDGEVLPLSASRYVQVAPQASTVYRGVAARTSAGASPTLTAQLTVVPRS